MCPGTGGLTTPKCAIKPNLQGKCVPVELMFSANAYRIEKTGMSLTRTPAFSAPDAVVSSTSSQAFQTADLQARKLVNDLHTPKPAIYWVDLLLSAAIGWGAFVVAVRSQLGSAGMFAGAAVAVFALYRGLCFVHEISHLRQSALRGFETVWNLLIGVPLLMPSFTYVGVHGSHHKLSTYGTEQDPEYLPFS